MDHGVKLQTINISDIRHTLVGNDVLAHCNKKTVKIEKEAAPVQWKVYHESKKTETIFYGDHKQENKNLMHNRNHLFSYENRTGTFDILLLIKNVSVEDEGQYSCEVKNQNDPSVVTGIMMYLFVHDPPETNPCKDNWLYFRPKKTCIRAHLNSMSWDEGRKFCKYHHNADLIKLIDKTMDDFVSSISDLDTAYWIGLYTPGKIDSYRWLDDLDPTIWGHNKKYWSVNYPIEKTARSCTAKGGQQDAAWRNMDCDVQNGVICQRSTRDESVWRAPPLWKVVVGTIIMMLILTSLTCCFLGIYPNRGILARLLGVMGRHDIVSEVMTANTVIVIYDSELNDLLKD